MQDYFLESLKLQRIDFFLKLVAASECSDEEKGLALQWVSELTDELMAKSEATNTTAQWMSSAEVTFMRIEIMIDKEQKISQSTLDALESELYRNLRPLYPKTVIRIRKGSSNGVELTGLQLDEERKQVMKIMQKVWEDDSWLH
ncbi:Prophage protein [Escherichia coli]|nr:Prophage protein [Escherichia coli]